MNHFTKWGLAIVCALAFAGTAEAVNVQAPITGGIIHVKFGATNDNPDATLTVSISVRRLDDGTQVFCQEVTTVDGVELVEGDTSIIANNTAQVLLEGVAWSDPGCTGQVSEGSIDVYHVVFARPGRPVMLPFTP